MRIAAGALLLLWSFPVICAADDRSDFFESRIRPVLIEKCSECHTADTPEGKFKIESLADLTIGGMSGPSLVIGKPDASELIKRLEHTDPKKLMPPEERLSAQQIADFKQWIQEGAVWPDASRPMMDPKAEAEKLPWAFRPLTNPTPPEVTDLAWCRNEIDRFIRAAQESRNLKPLAPADKRTLLRRVTLDLTGLPPTPAEIDAFLADNSPEAFNAVVERLLASPAYGERWGRYWLDLVRYADTSGDGTDTPIPEARYFRDYVISAFNQDLPYDQFLTEQLAGDILAKQTPDDPRNHEKIIATGFIALSRRFGNSRNAEYELIVDDTIDTMGRSMLGLSLGCARCHHHKFDPVSMEDYYGMFGYFHSTLYPHAGTEHQKDRADLIPISVPDPVKSTYDSLEAWAVNDKKEGVGDVPVYLAGDPHKKGDKAPRGYISSINPTKPTIPDGQSGRLELAKWIVSTDNPLTSRVVVNRIWQHHFGKGLVATPSNFGKQAEPASHPELLDWLAREFMNHGWSFKHLHRKILLSSTYRLGSWSEMEQTKLDEGNRYYWRFQRQRMDAESLRDSILAVSGTLQPGSNGRHPFQPNEKLKYNQGNPFNEIFDHNHRTVYLMEPRLNKHPFMALYDGPDPNKSTDQRSTSTVALQALSLMNGTFLKEKSTALAQRITKDAPDPQARIQLAYTLLLGRPAESTEQTEALDYIRGYEAQLRSEGRSAEEAETVAWTSFSRVMLSSNEFIYID